MKLLFISDIHGDVESLKIVLEKCREEVADYIIMLGDALYHGPRNSIPDNYNPKEVATILNEYKDKIIAIRGNCDSEVDQMLINYPMMSDYSVVLMKKRRVFLTHGHIYNKDNMLNLSSGDILAHGHTHIPVAEKVNDIYIVNPGSITFPKEGFKPTYGIMTEDKFEVKDFNGIIVKKIEIV